MNHAYRNTWISHSGHFFQNGRECKAIKGIRCALDHHMGFEAAHMVERICGSIVRLYLRNFEVFGDHLLHDPLGEWGSHIIARHLFIFLLVGNFYDLLLYYSEFLSMIFIFWLISLTIFRCEVGRRLRGGSCSLPFRAISFELLSMGHPNFGFSRRMRLGSDRLSIFSYSSLTTSSRSGRSMMLISNFIAQGLDYFR